MFLCLETDGEDIIDEALQYFKPNIFFREFEIKNASDRTLIYLTLYITECLRKLCRVGDSINCRENEFLTECQQNFWTERFSCASTEPPITYTW